MNQAASLVPLVVIAGYLGLLIALGVISGRFSKGTSADYFVVSRSIGPFLLLMSIFGTTMTGFALVGSTGKAYTSGIGVYGLMASWSGLVHSAVFFLVGIRLWAIGKRHGYVTQCAYFRDRFESPTLGYILFPILVLLVIPYLLVGVIAAGKFMQSTTAGMFPDLFSLPDLQTPAGSRPHPLSGGVPPWLGGLTICLIVLTYVFLGGLRGAVWANTFQTLVFMVTGVIAFTMIASRLGGLKAAADLVSQHAYAGPRMAREGLIGYGEFFSYCLIPLSVGMFPHLFQHWLTAKSARSFRLTVVAHPIFIMIVWVPCILIGLWAAAYLGPGANPNAVLGRMVGQLVHSPILSGLVGAGVLAAIMSSLDSQFMCLGTMFTNDIVVRWFGRHRFNDREKILLARVFIIAVVGVTYLLALWLKDSTHVFDLGVWCFTGFASLFPVVFAAVYWRRATLVGVMASLLVTTVTWCIFFYQDVVLHPGSTEDGEMLVFGVMPVAVIFVLSAAALVIGSLLTPPPSQSTLDRFFLPRKPASP